MTEPTGERDLVLLIPVYNDWAAVGMLLGAVDRVMAARGVAPRVLLVDDGSTTEQHLSLPPLESIRAVTVLALRRNLGHQRAIAIGLAFVHDRHPGATVAIMDGDGEDSPDDLPRLLDEFDRREGREIIFARRVRRSEGFIFALFYHLYRLAHHVLTGIPVRVGNFSVLPWSAIQRLVVVSDLWNHYAASVFQARIPFAMVPTRRAARLTGRSSMSFVALVTHGLSAIAAFADRVGVRVLVASLLGLLVVVPVAAWVGVARARSATPPSMELVVAVGLALLLLTQLAIGASLFLFTVLFGRAGAGFIPMRDYSCFILSDIELAVGPGDLVPLRR